MVEGTTGHTSYEELQLRALRSIIKNQCRIIKLLENKRTGGRLRVFLRKTWNAFSDRLSTNIGNWLAGLPPWLLALEMLGFRQWFAGLIG